MESPHCQSESFKEEHKEHLEFLRKKEEQSLRLEEKKKKREEELKEKEEAKKAWYFSIVR